ncbi:MAG: 5-formyltetrahydrofolate cyclo-ligase [Methanomicrobiales archaeon]|jgi:5-formyltetrahydrofolate cyclo-ligase|nr:5-formyltetrahydrofolate cyclo-ligase [Methanomicrobiales archaeon]
MNEKNLSIGNLENIRKKEELRDKLRNIRMQISPDDHAAWSRRACIHLDAFINEWISGPPISVLVYCSKPPELDTSLLIETLLTKQIPTLVPIIQQEDISLRLSHITKASSLICSTFQVPEPIGCEIPARPEDVSICIVPILGFCMDGARIGYGMGYFDRFFQKNPHIYKIGAAFSCQRCDEIPVTDDDIRMDLIITEHGIVYKHP